MAWALRMELLNSIGMRCRGPSSQWSALMDRHGFTYYERRHDEEGNWIGHKARPIDDHTTIRDNLHIAYYCCRYIAYCRYHLHRAG